MKKKLVILVVLLLLIAAALAFLMIPGEVFLNLQTDYERIIFSSGDYYVLELADGKIAFCHMENKGKPVYQCVFDPATGDCSAEKTEDSLYKNSYLAHADENFFVDGENYRVFVKSGYPGDEFRYGVSDLSPEGVWLGDYVVGLEYEQAGDCYVFMYSSMYNYDLPCALMVDGVMYGAYAEAGIFQRRGTLIGEVESECAADEFPTENFQSNKLDRYAKIYDVNGDMSELLVKESSQSFLLRPLDYVLPGPAEEEWISESCLVVDGKLFRACREGSAAELDHSCIYYGEVEKYTHDGALPVGELESNFPITGADVYIRKDGNIKEVLVADDGNYNWYRRYEAEE